MRSLARCAMYGEWQGQMTLPCEKDALVHIQYVSEPAGGIYWLLRRCVHA